MSRLRPPQNHVLIQYTTCVTVPGPDYHLLSNPLLIEVIPNLTGHYQRKHETKIKVSIYQATEVATTCHHPVNSRSIMGRPTWSNTKSNRQAEPYTTEVGTRCSTSRRWRPPLLPHREWTFLEGNVNLNYQNMRKLTMTDRKKK